MICENTVEFLCVGVWTLATEENLPIQNWKWLKRFRQRQEQAFSPEKQEDKSKTMSPGALHEMLNLKHALQLFSSNI